MTNETTATPKLPLELSLKERVDAADWRKNQELAAIRPLYASLQNRLPMLTEKRDETFERLVRAEQDAKNIERRMRIDKATLEEAEAAYRAVGECQEALDKLDDDIAETKRQLELMDPQKALDLEYEAKLRSQLVLVEAYQKATGELATALFQAHKANELVSYIHDSARDQFGVPIGVEDPVRMPSAAGLSNLEWPELVNDWRGSRYYYWLRECEQAIAEMAESQRQLQRKWDKLQAQIQKPTKQATKAS